MSEQPEQRRMGAIRIGRVSGVPIYVNWSWFVVALLIALVVMPDIQQRVPELGAWSYAAGFGFAVLLYGSVLLHEISHVLVARAYDLPVRAITLQLLGGISEIEREPGSPWREFWVAVVGPLTSLGISAAAYGALQFIDGPTLLVLFVGSLAWANLIVGIFNLLPGLPLDGGRILRALIWGVSKRPHLGTVVAAWAGRAVALLVIATPWILASTLEGSQGDGWPDLLHIAWSVLIAGFLWAGSTQALVASRIRKKLPNLKARALARRGLPVSSDLSLAEALRRAKDRMAGALVVVDNDGRPSGLVNEAAVLATPEHRRPWMPVGDLARSLEPGLVLSADLIGEELVRAMGGSPASEYLLVENDGSVYGVLVTTDVEGAFSRA